MKNKQEVHYSCGKAVALGRTAFLSFFLSLTLAAGAQSYSGSLAEVRSGNSYSDSAYQELQKKASYLAGTWGISVEDRLSVRSDYAKASLERGDEQEAYVQLSMAVRLDAWAFEEQILLAELEMSLNRNQTARDRLIFVVREAPPGAVKSYAAQLLAEPALKNLDYPEPPFLDRGVFYLATYGQIPPELLSSLRSRLAMELGVQVKITPRPLDLDPLRFRNKLEPYFDSVLSNLKTELGEEELARQYEAHGIPAEGPQTLEQKGILVRSAMLSQENGEMLWRIALWQNQNQMEVMGLYAQLQRKAAPLFAEPNVLGVLAVTNYDLFTKNTDFVFGFGEDNLHLMSIHRLIGPAEAVVNTLRLSSLQALNASVKMLGVGRTQYEQGATAPVNDPREIIFRQDVLALDTREALSEKYKGLSDE